MSIVMEWARAVTGAWRRPADLAVQRSSVVPSTLVPRWAGPLFLLMAAALVPWVVYLAVSLPTRTVFNHYRTAWVGFDILLVLVMARTAFLALKGSRRIELPASATATLLIVDAWFDITTSRAGAPRMEAILLALFVELPTAALAIYISRRVERTMDAALEHLGDVPEEDQRQSSTRGCD